MQGREHQVTGLGGGDGRLDRFEIPHLTHQDDVGVLTQDVLQGVGERMRVGPDLPLVDHGTLVVVQVLDGVLDRHDVDVLLAVDHVDQRGQAG